MKALRVTATAKPREFNGPAILVALLREIEDPRFRQDLIAKVNTFSPILARLADEFTFVFSDLVRMEDGSLQTLIGLVPEKHWLLAWKLSSEAVKAKLLANMSERRRASFLVEAKAAPRVRRTEVLLAQAAITRVAVALLQKGKLRLHSRRPSLRRVILSVAKNY